ncbi:MAG TPA: signal peptidase I [Verrucomicrobiota bacterium]|nr:signal peptidase I [Verrucomicrobiota bacterium]
MNRNHSLVPIALAILAGVAVSTLIVLRLLGLICPYSVPTGAMTPAVSAGDHVFAEGFTYLKRKPQRGDVIVFKTDGIPLLPTSTIYVKRVVGIPGDHLELSDGSLFIDGTRVALSNAYGEISYKLPPQSGNISPITNVLVPADRYFVIGDNATNSLDSRFFGFVPAKNIKGRISICYWPPSRIGLVK